MGKYKLPSNHELFQSRSVIDLLVEFWEDIFTDNPSKMLQADDGTFTDTGDTLIDKWEREIADGNLPDLREAFREGEISRIRNKFDAQKKRKGNVAAASTFEDVHNALQDHLARNVPTKMF